MLREVASDSVRLDTFLLNNIYQEWSLYNYITFTINLLTAIQNVKDDFIEPFGRENFNVKVRKGKIEFLSLNTGISHDLTHGNLSKSNVLVIVDILREIWCLGYSAKSKNKQSDETRHIFKMALENLFLSLQHGNFDVYFSKILHEQFRETLNLLKVIDIEIVENKKTRIIHFDYDRANRIGKGVLAFDYTAYALGGVYKLKFVTKDGIKKSYENKYVIKIVNRPIDSDESEEDRAELNQVLYGKISREAEIARHAKQYKKKKNGKIVFSNRKVLGPFSIRFHLNDSTELPISFAIIIPYAPGVTLFKYLDTIKKDKSLLAKKFTPHHQATLTLNLIEATITQIHDNGIIHRDLSSKNLMIDNNHEVVIYDFDNSKFKGEKIKEFGGTPYYWPPEQSNYATLQQSTELSDAYTVGKCIEKIWAVSNASCDELKAIREIVSMVTREKQADRISLVEMHEKLLTIPLFKKVNSPLENKPLSAISSSSKNINTFFSNCSTDKADNSFSHDNLLVLKK